MTLQDFGLLLYELFEQVNEELLENQQVDFENEILIITKSWFPQDHDEYWDPRIQLCHERCFSSQSWDFGSFFGKLSDEECNKLADILIPDAEIQKYLQGSDSLIDIVEDDEVDRYVRLKELVVALSQVVTIDR